jgi:hypothetical protein
MTPISVTLNDAAHCFKFKLKGLDNANVQRAINGNITVSDYAHAYVAFKAQEGAFYMVPKVSTFPTTQGSSFGLNVTATVKDAAGNLVDTVTFAVVLMGPPLPPNATSVSVEGPTVADLFDIPADPGIDTIVF